MKLLKPYCNYFRILAFGIFFLIGSSTFAQNEDGMTTTPPDSLNLILKQLNLSHLPGKVNVIPHDDRILNLLWRHVNYKDSVGIYGWKVLIYNGRSRNEATESEALFLNSFPDMDVPTKVIYPEPPDFKTVIGVFRTKEEAFRLQQKIKNVFLYCYLVFVRLEKGELN